MENENQIQQGSEFIDRTHRKVGDGDEDTKRLVEFLASGLSAKDKELLERQKREKGEAATERANLETEVWVSFLRGEIGQDRVYELPENSAGGGTKTGLGDEE